LNGRETVTEARELKATPVQFGVGLFWDEPLHDASERPSKRWQEGVHNGEGAEHGDVEFAPEGVEWQHLNRPRGGAGCRRC
jgi:hypothetical protein